MKKLGISLVIIFAGATYYFTANDEEVLNEATPIRVLKESGKSITYNDSDKRDKVVIEKIDPALYQKPKKVSSKRQSSEAKKKILELYKDTTLDLSNKIELIKLYQVEIEKYDFSEGISERAKVTQMKPEMVITLSLVLENSIDEILSESFDPEIPISDMYLVKTFSESNDFKILISQNRLTPEVISMKRLREIYANENETVEDLKTGETLGVPSDEPSAPPPDDDDIDN